MDNQIEVARIGDPLRGRDLGDAGTGVDIRFRVVADHVNGECASSAGTRGTFSGANGSADDNNPRAAMWIDIGCDHAERPTHHGDGRARDKRVCRPLFNG